METDPRPLRIAFHCEPVVPATVHIDCKTAVEDAALLCSELGHHVEEVSPKHEPLLLGRAFLKVIAANALDRISGNRFTTCYAYHHGYFDAVERGGNDRGLSIVTNPSS